MNDQQIFAQIFRDIQQHSSAESVLRDKLAAQIRELEQEVDRWNNESFKDDQKIRNLKYMAEEYRRALSQIAQAKSSDGAIKMSLDSCVQLAAQAIQQGDSYAQETESTETHRPE